MHPVRLPPQLSREPRAVAGSADRLGPLALHALSAMPHTCLLVVDTELRFQAVAGAALAPYGYTAERLVGRSIAEVVPRSLALRVTTLFATALAGREAWDDRSWDSRVPVPAAESAPGPAQQTTYSPVRQDDGTVVGAVAVVREVGAERRALDVLVAAGDQHREVTRHAGDVLATFDAHGRFAWVSDSVTRATGWSPEELVGRRAYDLLHPEDAEGTRTRLQELYRGRVETTAEYRYRHRDGRWVWFEARVRPLQGRHGGVRGLVAAARDVDDRKLLEQDLVRESETFGLAFAQAPIGMALVRPDQTWLEVNGALCAILGRERDELLETGLQPVLDPAAAGPALAQLGEVLDGSRSEAQLETTLRRPDSSLVPVLVTMALVRDGQRRARFVVMQVEDVTERRRQQDELVHRASTDPLTGLPNRTVLFDRLGHALAAAPRRHVDVAVVFVDLDGFKAINDTAGHGVGDEVLQQVAQRLRDAVREEDTVARFGGDEFVVLYEAVADAMQIEVLVARLRASLVEPLDVAGAAIHVGLTIGVASGSNTTAEDLLHRADAAMYVNKLARGAQVSARAASRRPPLPSS